MAAEASGTQDLIQDEQKPLATAYSSNRAPWTAARCNRLLRPLSSKINLLRKAKRLGLKEDDLFKRNPSSSSTLKRSSREPPVRKTHRIGSDASDSADEEWAPNPRPSKKIRRTYSSRSGIHHQILAETTEVKALRCPRRALKEISIPKDYITTRPQSSQNYKIAEVAQATLSQDTDQSQSEEQNPQPRLQATTGSTHAASRSFFTKKWSSQSKLAEGICNGLQTLLTATEGKRSAYRRGARSLFSTCLRQVPVYIAEEERWCKADELEGDLDISSTVYGHLESLCAAPNAGWGPLRQVVRAHGVTMIGDAIKESLLTFSLTRQLTAMCIQQAAWDEAQHFIESLITLLVPGQKHGRQADLTSMLFGIIDEFITSSGRVWFRYQQIASMLKLGKLPVDWIARHDMIDCWNTAVYSVTREDDHSKEAGELLRLVVAMGYGGCNRIPGREIHGLRLESGGYSNIDKNNDSDHSDSSDSSPEENSYGGLLNFEHHANGNSKSSATASSLLTVLCAIGLLRSAPSTSSPSGLQASNLTVLEYMATDAYQFLELSRHVTGFCHSLQKHWTLHPLLANDLVQATACRSWQEFDRGTPSLFKEMGHIGSITALSDNGAPFLCAVAECCARASCEETFDHMQKLVKHVSGIANTLEYRSTGRELCDQICLAAAFEYAEGSKQPKHLHWALDVEQTITGATVESARRTPHKTPTRGLAQTKTGYRWEAGICEWVAKTPAMELLHPETRELGHDVARQRYSNRPPLQERRPAAFPTAELACQFESPVCRTKGLEIAKNDGNAAPQAGRSDVRRKLRSGKVVGKNGQGGNKLLFSHIHIHIEDMGDELSNEEMSHRRGTRHDKELREVSNIGLTLPRRRGGPKGWQKAGPIQRSGTTAWRNGVGVDVKTEVWDSEDELSFL
ncbi:MAG: hypothetical protein LQ342_001178 [Letrouitia transgressa]|nr:MAG: hypothetical protein LQ342_001178 [Letrouitia transgressa]